MTTSVGSLQSGDRQRADVDLEAEERANQVQSLPVDASCRTRGASPVVSISAGVSQTKNAPEEGSRDVLLITSASRPLLDRLARLLGCANQNAALAIEALCGQSVVLAEGVHQVRPNAGQVEVAAEIRRLVGPSQLARLAPEHVPRFVIDRSAPHALGAKLDLDPRASWYRGAHEFLPDRYSVHCTLQIHGTLLDQLRRAQQIAGGEVADCAETLGARSGPQSPGSESAVAPHRVSTTNGVAHLKAAIAALSSISERRLAKLLDPSQNNGLPAALVPNPDGNHYGLMVLRYRAAMLVSELSELATPVRPGALAKALASASPTRPENADSTGADSMCDVLQSVLALERYAAVQALRVRLAMLARMHRRAAAPAPGEFAQHVLSQFDRAGLLPIWDGQKRPHEIDTVRRLMVARPQP